MGANDSKQKFPGAEPVASGQMPAPAGNADEGMWDWRAGRPPSLAATPNPSAHGAQAFKEMSNDSKEGSTHGGLMKRSVSFLWDWGGNRTPDANATPGNSLHGGNKFAKPGDSAHGGVSFWNWSSGRSPDVSVAGSRDNSTHGAAAYGSSRHGGKSFWNWSDGREPDAVSVTPNGSVHGGNGSVHGGNGTPGSPGTVTPGSSRHGGGILKGVNWQRDEAKGPSRSSSLHGGVAFAPNKGPSRSSSLHGGVAFAPKAIQEGKEKEGSVHAGQGMKRNTSFSGDFWNWGRGREVDQPPTPDGSGRATPIVDESIVDGHGAGTAPPTGALGKMGKRIGSFGSLWDWSLGRESTAASPSSSREGSIHGGERQAAGGMPMAVKIQYGQEKERPV